MDGPEEGSNEPITIKVVWQVPEGLPILQGNNFAIHHNNNEEFVLSIGQLQPPVILGTLDERREQAKEVSHVPIRVIGRYSLTRTNVEQLASILVEHLAKLADEKPPAEER